MKAHVGDRIVVASPKTGGSTRDGEVVEIRGADGAPPYVVRWSDNDNPGLFFPGSDAHVSGSQEVASAVPPRADSKPHIRSWRVDIDLYESGDDTSAHAVLVAESPVQLDGRGQAHRNPGDVAVPEIGDEVAVARALRRLSDRLLETASSDISGVQGRSTTISE
jgi:hypothetical protein